MPIKTQKTNLDVIGFLEALDDKDQIEESKKLLKIFQKSIGKTPYIWGDSIIGFGEYDYESAKGYSKCKWFHCGFSPRKGKFSLYFSASVLGETDLLEKIGKYKSGKSCLYIKNLDQIDLEVLMDLIKRGYNKSIEQAKKANS